VGLIILTYGDGQAVMTRILSPFFLLLVLGLLTSCATSPKLNTEGIDLGITPQRAVADNATLQGRSVLWGGVIVNSANLKEKTQIEILAYPLDSDQRPDLDKNPLGRFLAQQEGYLETSDYSQGRLITVSGKIGKNLDGRIGETDYTYPVIQIKQHYLWPKRSNEPESSVHFGIGVIFHN
jgi:outer membrane lipoprotein